MTETQQRFLKAIADRVPSERVAEVRLFPTVRAGTVESGVAIVAATEMPGEPPVEMPEQSPERSRLSILTAHFRHTLKGADRGKWEFEMVHDADAPLETVESVVRGVARRAGEDGEPDRLTADEFQRVLAEPWWKAPA